MSNQRNKPIKAKSRSENKSTNIFGSSITSAESRFGTSGVFSFGRDSTFPSFGTMLPNNSPGETQPSDIITSNTFSATESKIKFKPVSGTDVIPKNGITQSCPVLYQCITFMDQFKSKSFEELRYEYYILHLQRTKLHRAISKQKSSAVNKNYQNPFDLKKNSLLDNCEPPKLFQKELPTFNYTSTELQKPTKATSPGNEAVHSEAIEKLTEMVNSHSFRLDQLEQFSYLNSIPTKENPADLLPWNLYKPKLQLTEKKVPEDSEVQHLAGILNCVILTVPEQDRKEIEFLMLLVSAWPTLPGYVKMFTYNKMEILWQALSNSIRSDNR